jgi:hypothetical protein
MAVLVLFDPVPIITGILLLTKQTTNLIIFVRSSFVIVEDSPVVPSITIAFVPFAI